MAAVLSFLYFTSRYVMFDLVEQPPWTVSYWVLDWTLTNSLKMHLSTNKSAKFWHNLWHQLPLYRHHFKLQLLSKIWRNATEKQWLAYVSPKFCTVWYTQP